MPRKRKEQPAVSETTQAAEAAAPSVATEGWQPAPGAAQALAEAAALEGQAVNNGDGVTVVIVPEPKRAAEGREVETVFPGLRRFDY